MPKQKYLFRYLFLVIKSKYILIGEKTSFLTMVSIKIKIKSFEEKNYQTSFVLVEV